MQYSFDRFTSKRLRKQRIHLLFVERLGYAPNFDNPQTYNEKIQWLKLYYRDPLIIQCSDKYAVRGYVGETIGEEYLINLLGVYKRAEDIDFKKLPSQFVLKANNGWNKNIICTDKAELDIDIARKMMNKWIEPRSNHYYRSYEWGYKDIDPKIICDEYIETSSDQELVDYKFHCFNGQPRFIGACSQRLEDLRVDYYDTEWERLPFAGNSTISDTGIDKPKHLELMLKLAKKLAKPFPFVRVDFYEVDGKVLFGELSFTPSEGFNRLKPLEWDYRLGDMLILPKTRKRMQYFLYRLRNAVSQSN